MRLYKAANQPPPLTQHHYIQRSTVQPPPCTATLTQPHYQPLRPARPHTQHKLTPSLPAPAQPSPSNHTLAAGRRRYAAAALAAIASAAALLPLQLAWNILYALGTSFLASVAHARCRSDASNMTPTRDSLLAQRRSALRDLWCSWGGRHGGGKCQCRWSRASLDEGSAGHSASSKHVVRAGP